jgi:NAD(P)-dependent dehydrogenase (short-subunit alcohol dehydrogenase family)
MIVILGRCNDKFPYIAFQTLLLCSTVLLTFPYTEKIMKVVIVGAAGLIGKAVTALLTDKGHEIVQASRNTKPSLNLDDPASIEAFYKTLGEVDAVICTAPKGGGGMGPLTGFSDEVIDSYTKGKLLGQVNLVRKGLSNLRPGGVFILTGGMSGFLPIPKSSISAMFNMALDKFVNRVAPELQDGRRIVIVHPAAVREWAIQMGMDGTQWPTVATVAETYLKALDGTNTGEPVFVEGYGP